MTKRQLRRSRCICVAVTHALATCSCSALIHAYLAAAMRDVSKFNSSYLEFSLRLLDAAALLLAGHFATYFRFYLPIGAVAPIHAVMLYFCSSLAFLLFPQFDLYVSWRGRSLTALAFRLAMSWSLILLIGLVFSFLIHHVGDLSRLWMLYWYLSGIALLFGCRFLAYLLLRQLRAQGLNNRRVIIVGYNEIGREMHLRASQQVWYGYEVAGVYVSNGADEVPLEDATVRRIARLEDIADQVAAHHIDELWITLPMTAAPELQALHYVLRNVLADVRWIPNVLSMRVLSLQMIDFLGFPAIDLNAPVSRGGQEIIKTLFDKFFSAAVLMMLSPLLMAIAIGVKYSSPGPVLFKQSRLGLNGRKFDVYKFRTMAAHQDQGVTQACLGDRRVTAFGAFLRHRSLDELPQFFNVLRGDMSVVGPRPHALAHNEIYKQLLERYMLRHRVKPGITGWAQIHGYRGETDTVDKMEKRVQFDLYYIQNWSLWMDVRIVLRTALGGWTGKNVY